MGSFVLVKVVVFTANGVGELQRRINEEFGKAADGVYGSRYEVIDVVISSGYDGECAFFLCAVKIGKYVPD